MIRFTNVHKWYPNRSGRTHILKDINFQLNKGERLGVVGGNGAGKSTLIRLASGSERPTSGSVERTFSVSWPLALAAAFQYGLTGLDNMRFICRVYGVDPDDIVDFVHDFTELGRYMREPLYVYSSGMMARLAFALSMAIEFDCYLIDEVTAVGDYRFQQKCHVELFEKRADRAMMLVSHNEHYLASHCTHGALLDGGVLTVCGDVEEALRVHEERTSLYLAK